MQARYHLLKIEQDLIDLVKDEKRVSYKFPIMSSYYRMLVHRVAAYFGFERNIEYIDEKKARVIVNKKEGKTRLPELRFKDQIKQFSEQIEEPKKLILKRDTNSLEDSLMNENRLDGKLLNSNNLDSRRSKSLEERVKDYETAKARIFNQSATKNDLQLSNNMQNEFEKCNLDNQSKYNNNNSTVNSSLNSSKHKSNESLKNFNLNNYTSNNHFDSGQASAYSNDSNLNYASNNNQIIIDPHHPHSTLQFNQNLNSNSQFNNHHEFKLNHEDSKNFYKSNNNYKGKSIKGNNNSLKNSSNSSGGSNGGGIKQIIKNQQQQQQQQQQHFYQSNLPLPPQQMINPIDQQQQQLYSNWIPADLNAQQQADCFAKQQQQQLYQSLPYNQLSPHPNQQKLFLLCNYPGTGTF